MPPSELLGEYTRDKGRCYCHMVQGPECMIWSLLKVSCWALYMQQVTYTADPVFRGFLHVLGACCSVLCCMSV